MFDRPSPIDCCFVVILTSDKAFFTTSTTRSSYPLGFTLLALINSMSRRSASDSSTRSTDSSSISANQGGVEGLTWRSVALQPRQYTMAVAKRRRPITTRKDESRFKNTRSKLSPPNDDRLKGVPRSYIHPSSSSNSRGE